jgi:hypothetical protein
MIELKYWNQTLQIGMADWKTVYKFPQKELMVHELHQGNLYYRRKGSDKRISYKQLKKRLKKTAFYHEGNICIAFLKTYNNSYKALNLSLVICFSQSFPKAFSQTGFIHSN